jgi:glycerol uptake facilitator-like aquaporin
MAGVTDLTDTRARRLCAEALGTALLLAAVVGSGIMGDRLAAGNVAVALLANTLATFAVGLWIAAAYWFTASTSFANPAVTLARSVTDTFAGIRPADAPGFILAQAAGAAVATALFRWLTPSLSQSAKHVVVPREER